ncbi:RNA methyltransferase [Arenibacter sp. GZD96]|uniref:TrmH family RNA methyltransferase n=1 Tax=Aurantibrevibacter litoralis TaxID=3106030 RepID=UPI002AFF0598|nr:RNA methyltransferase [Arenibacter sp. GZD-96]MEA1785092.1 RNA methyltransferase [Arenibacter sp. GZD-96]
MNNVKYISSVQNAAIKKTLLLQEKARERKKTGLFVVEGVREVQLALKGGYAVEYVLFQNEIISEEAVLSLFQKAHPYTECFSLSRDVYQKIAYRTTTEGIIAVLKSKSHTLSSLQLKTENPLILVAEAPEKPGNLGALLRTADAAKLDAVLIANPRSDLYSPNIIRSSVGCIFTNTIATGSTAALIDFLIQKNISIFCASLDASDIYTATDFTKPTAIVVGTEADGLTTDWLTHATQNIVIPMQGEIDSMNVSVSAAILIFEAKRQRGWHGKDTA